MKLKTPIVSDVHFWRAPTKEEMDAWIADMRIVTNNTWSIDVVPFKRYLKRSGSERE